MRASSRVVIVVNALVLAIVMSASSVVADPSASAERHLFHDLFPPPPLVVAGAPPAQTMVLESAVAQGQAAPPPEPAHTGFGALARDTFGDFKAFPRRQSTWVILGIGAGAALITHPADDYVHDHVSNSQGAKDFFVLGKYLGAVYTQAAVAVGLYVAGRFVAPATKDAQKTNKLSHLGFDMMRGLIVSQALTQAIKYTAQRDRPTGECCSFPSGHATAAFTTASILERHFGYRGAWPTFVAATYVAFSRIADNRHFLSDVMFGSALGMATGWTVVGRHGRENYAFVPVPVHGGVALMFTRVPKTAAAAP